MVSGMTINYHKSELVPSNLDEAEFKIFLDIFKCVQGAFPIKYLGIPLHYDKLRREDMQPLIDALEWLGGGGSSSLFLVGSP